MEQLYPPDEVVAEKAGDLSVDVHNAAGPGIYFKGPAAARPLVDIAV